MRVAGKTCPVPRFGHTSSARLPLGSPVAPELASAYTFAGGNLWPLVLVAVLLAPGLCARMQRDGRRPAQRR